MNGERSIMEFKYEITEKIGILSENPNGWSRQFNMISWNDREPKFDIRDWAPGNEKMSKGISLTREEIKTLKELLNEMEL